MEQRTVKIETPDICAAVFGSFDANIKSIEKAFSVTIQNRPASDGDALTITERMPTICASRRRL